MEHPGERRRQLEVVTREEVLYEALVKALLGLGSKEVLSGLIRVDRVAAEAADGGAAAAGTALAPVAALRERRMGDEPAERERHDQCHPEPPYPPHERAAYVT